MIKLLLQYNSVPVFRIQSRFLILLIAFTFLMVGKVTAQTGTVQGRITGADRKPLPLATLTVFSAKDTTILTYRMSNDNGEFKIPNLPLNIPVRLLATYVGYEAYRKNFTLTADLPVLKLDTIEMQPTSKDLEEIVVIAERPPVMVRNDTIEFNANAFKTLPNALVEDLLRKLPGVQVDADGNITVGGKPVNKILVDGKSFFGNDPKMASRNLPAHAIEKVQAMDDKEQAMLNGDNNTSNVGKVINITLKKGFKKGAFGKVYAGTGTSDRYEAGGIISTFRDTLQVSVLGYSNNLNRPGFSYGELMNAGGLQRTNSNRNSNSTSMYQGANGSMISINGQSFGGNTGFGLATSSGAGINLNHAPDKRKSVYLQYYFGEVRNQVNTDRLTEIYNRDTVVSNRRLSNALIKNYGHNLGAGFKLKPNERTTINFNASYSLGLQRENPVSTISSVNNQLGPQSDGVTAQINKLDNSNYNHYFWMLRQGASDKRRQFGVTHQLNIGRAANDFSTNASVHYSYPTSYDSVQNQLRLIRLPQTEAVANWFFNEPVSKWFTLRFNQRYRYNHVANSTDIRFANTQGGEFDAGEYHINGNFNRNQHDLYFSQRLSFERKGLIITAGIDETLLYSRLITSALPYRVNRDLQKLTPVLNVNYKNLSVSYSKSFSLPSYNYLLPVTDNTSPYYVVNGNPLLRPTETGAWIVSYNYANQEKLFNIWFQSAYELKNNDVVQKIVVDEGGIQTTTPVNADGTRNLRLNFNINKDFKINDRDKFTVNGGGFYSIMESNMLYNTDISRQTTNQIVHWIGANLNLHDVLEWRNSYTPEFNFTRYSGGNFSNLNLQVHGLVTSVVLRWPKHFVWENNWSYQYNSNLTGSNKTTLRWNAAINYVFLKDDRGALKLSAFDLLNQNQNMARLIVTQNTLTLNRGNLMPRHFLLTFTYNIRKIGSKKQKVGGQSLFSL